jgi:hypothetical protein
MMLEEMELDGVATRATVALGPAPCPPERGGASTSSSSAAGMSGLLAGIRLGGRHPLHDRREERRGRRHLVREPLPGLPGRRRQPLLLLLVRARTTDWTEFFAQQPELQAYFDRMRPTSTASRPHPLRDRGGRRRAVGRRRRAGRSSAHRRRRDRELAPTRSSAPSASSTAQAARHPGRDASPARDPLGPVGDGTPSTSPASGSPSSAPAPAPSRSCRPSPPRRAAHVFQRSAQWMFPNPNYHDAVGEGVRWALRHLPFYGRWYRFLLFWPGCDGGLPAMPDRPDWPHQDRAVSELNDIARQMFTQWMAEQVGDDPSCSPRCPRLRLPRQAHAAGQRQLAAALTRDDVELVTDPIAEITRAGRSLRRAAPRRRRHRLGHRLPRQPLPVADGDRRPRRRRARRAVGRRPVRLPRHHRAELPEPLLHVRAGHQPGPRRQPHLPLGVPGPLHPGLPEASHRGRRRRHRVQTGGARRLQPPPARRARADGVVAPVHRAQLVPQRGRPRHRPVAVAPGRLLAWTKEPNFDDFVVGS